MWPVLAQFMFKCINKRPVLSIDWAYAAKLVIMFGNLEHPLVWDISASQNILQKWDDLIYALRAAERHNEYRIISIMITHKLAVRFSADVNNAVTNFNPV